MDAADEICLTEESPTVEREDTDNTKVFILHNYLIVHHTYEYV